MAASLIGIMALVWVNMSSSTAAIHQVPPGTHRPAEITSASVEHQRSKGTRWPVWSLNMPQP